LSHFLSASFLQHFLSASFLQQTVVSFLQHFAESAAVQAATCSVVVASAVISAAGVVDDLQAKAKSATAHTHTNSVFFIILLVLVKIFKLARCKGKIFFAKKQVQYFLGKSP
jgi:hypothetical protein